MTNNNDDITPDRNQSDQTVIGYGCQRVLAQLLELEQGHNTYAAALRRKARLGQRALSRALELLVCIGWVQIAQQPADGSLGKGGTGPYYSLTPHGRMEAHKRLIAATATPPRTIAGQEPSREQVRTRSIDTSRGRLVLEHMLKLGEGVPTYAAELARVTGVPDGPVRRLLSKLMAINWVRHVQAPGNLVVNARPGHLYSLTGLGRDAASELLQIPSYGREARSSPGPRSLREIRLALRLKQVDVAERMGVSQQSHVSSVERCANPTVQTLIAYAWALGERLHIQIGDAKVAFPPPDGPPRATRLAARTDGRRSSAMLAFLAAVAGARGLTQTELGERLGLTHHAVAKLERKPNPKVRTLDTYARGHGKELIITIGDVRLALPNPDSHDSNSQATASE